MRARVLPSARPLSAPQVCGGSAWGAGCTIRTDAAERCPRAHPADPPSPFAGDAVAIAHHQPSGPPPAPTEQATAPRSVAPSHPRLRAATAPTCHHNSHGHPRGSTTPLTTYHWLCHCPPPKRGYACALGGKAHHHLAGMGMVPRHARGGGHQTSSSPSLLTYPCSILLPSLPTLQEELLHLLVTLIPA